MFLSKRRSSSSVTSWSEHYKETLGLPLREADREDGQQEDSSGAVSLPQSETPGTINGSNAEKASAISTDKENLHCNNHASQTSLVHHSSRKPPIPHSTPVINQQSNFTHPSTVKEEIRTPACSNKHPDVRMTSVTPVPPVQVSLPLTRAATTCGSIHGNNTEGSSVQSANRSRSVVKQCHSRGVERPVGRLVGESGSDSKTPSPKEYSGNPVAPQNNSSVTPQVPTGASCQRPESLGVGKTGMCQDNGTPSRCVCEEVVVMKPVGVQYQRKLKKLRLLGTGGSSKVRAGAGGRVQFDVSFCAFSCNGYQALFLGHPIE